MHVYRHRATYARPVEALFALHEDPELIRILTPPGRAVITVPHTDGIREGSQVVLRLTSPLLTVLPDVSLPGAGTGPLGWPWHALHTRYNPPHLFEDVQVSGPFARWRHRHAFRPVSDSSTTVVDLVSWQLPIPLRPLTGLVRTHIRELFTYRESALRAYLGCEPGEG